MSWSQPAFHDLARRVAGRTGLDFPPDRRAGAEVGIRRAMVKARQPDADRYLDWVLDNPAALDDLVAELTIGETYFFREPDQFRFIREVVLPDVRRRRGPLHSPRCWSAACSTGEEAYSLAIVLIEALPEVVPSVLGTDISKVSLETASRGIFSDWSIRGEGGAEVARYLRRIGSHHELAEPIRKAVDFRPLNLADDDYPSLKSSIWGMDLILCRNVLIYFDRATIRAVANRLYETLSEGGWLIVASSDPPLAHEAPFEVELTDRGVFYRRGDRAWSPGRSPEAPASAVDVAVDIEAPTDRWAPETPTIVARPTSEMRAPEADPLDMSAQVRALANADPAKAERACASAATRHPLAFELHHLRAILLLDLGRAREAAEAARRAIYLDRSLAASHFLLGSILEREGDAGGALRAFRNARDLCASRPPGEIVPLTDGETAARLGRAAEARLERRVDGATP